MTCRLLWGSPLYMASVLNIEINVLWKLGDLKKTPPETHPQSNKQSFSKMKCVPGNVIFLLSPPSPPLPLPLEPSVSFAPPHTHSPLAYIFLCCFFFVFFSSQLFFLIKK